MSKAKTLENLPVQSWLCFDCFHFPSFLTLTKTTNMAAQQILEQAIRPMQTYTQCESCSRADDEGQEFDLLTSDFRDHIVCTPCANKTSTDCRSLAQCLRTWTWTWPYGNCLHTMSTCIDWRHSSSGDCRGTTNIRRSSLRACNDPILSGVTQKRVISLESPGSKELWMVPQITAASSDVGISRMLPIFWQAAGGQRLVWLFTMPLTFLGNWSEEASEDCKRPVMCWKGRAKERKTEEIWLERILPL